MITYKRFAVERIAKHTFLRGFTKLTACRSFAKSAETPPPPPRLKPLRAAKWWPPLPPPLPATAASLKWAPGKSSLDEVQSRFLEASTPRDQALAVWNDWQVRPSRPRAYSMDDAALKLLQGLVSDGNSDDFAAVLGSQKFGTRQQERTKRAGKLIQRFRGARQVRTHAAMNRKSEDGVIPKIVEWVESEGAIGARCDVVGESERNSTELSTEPFFKFTFVPVAEDVDMLMYVYCQAGYTEDALALWRRQVAGTGVKSLQKPVAASGLVNLLCNRATQSESGNDRVRNIDDIVEVIRDTHELGVRLFPGVAKGLHVLVEGLAESGLSCHDADDVVATTARQLDGVISVLSALQTLHRIPPRRRTFSGLLRLCCSTVHLEGSNGKTSHRAAEMFALLELSKEPPPPTRYEYTLLVAALADAHTEDHPSVSSAVSAMGKGELLPLSDVGVLRRAKDGDVAALKGALLVRRMTSDPLNVRTATTLISILVAQSDRAGPSAYPVKYARQALAIWNEFQANSAQLPLETTGLFVADLQLFNAALAAAARLPDDPALVEGITAELTTLSKENPAFSFDSYTFNTLIDAFGRRNELGACWAILDQMEANGVAPTIVTYNTISKACALNGNLDESLMALEIAESKGVHPDHISFRALKSIFGASNAMVEAIREAEMNLEQNRRHVDSGSLPLLAEGGGNASLAEPVSEKRLNNGVLTLTIDLHHFGVAEAKARITRELDAIHEDFFLRRGDDQEIFEHSFQSARPYDDGDSCNELNRRRTAAGRPSGIETAASLDSAPSTASSRRQVQTPSLPELVLITGVGKGSAAGAEKAVLREAVIDMLSAEGIAFHAVPGNPGRLVVAPPDLEAMFQRHRDRQLKTLGASWLSYQYVLIPSLLATVLVVPKLMDFYSLPMPPVG